MTLDLEQSIDMGNIIRDYRMRHSVIGGEWKRWFPKGMGGQESRTWMTADVHMVLQNWSNTSGGWQGIGGAAMTDAYTTVIVNHQLKFFCVYFKDKFAYMAELNEKSEKYQEDWSRLPGMKSVDGRLDIIYKSKG